MEKVCLERTQKGYPAGWECGGGYSNTGRVTLWADVDGSPPRAIYIRRRGHLACENHALIPIKEGMYRIYAYHHREDFKITIDKVVRLEYDKERELWWAEMERIATFDLGEWDNEPSGNLLNAVEVAKRKATVYHCREAYYISILNKGV